jgi:cullin 1
VQVLDTELLQRRQTELLEKEGSGCRVLLLNDSNEDLARMFRLFSRIPDGLVPMAEIFRGHVTYVGAEKIDARLARCEGAGAGAGAGDASKEKGEGKEGKEGKEEKETNDDPQFIKDLLSVHEKYINMVTAQFASNTLFQKALKDAFNDLVNRDVGKFKTADLVSSFCDRYVDLVFLSCYCFTPVLHVVCMLNK